MSINHFSQSLQGIPWWSSQYPTPQKPAAHHHHHQASLVGNYSTYHSVAARGMSFNLNRGGDDEESSELEEQVIDFIGEHEAPEFEKELMFEKSLTPSDVGKLNRLVIPKQHAERYFPLSGGKTGDKGLLLSFEDECGKCWRFRYSYWSSSQSYVLTKGWSRYVKEKRLDAGDVILFERHRVDIGRVFIGWRRRQGELDDGVRAAVQPPRGWAGATAATTSSSANNKRRLYHSYPSQPGHGPCTVTVCTPPSGSTVQNETAVVLSTNSKTLRLFGVDVECQVDEPEPEPEPDPPTLDVSSSLSSPGLSHQQQQPCYHVASSLHQMDVTFTQGVNFQQVRNHRG